MKKLKKLSLNKDVISKLDASKVTGGGGITAFPCDTVNNCPTPTNPCNITDTKKTGCATGPAPTAEAGCTRETIELSFCNGIGLPDGCQSVGVCA